MHWLYIGIFAYLMIGWIIDFRLREGEGLDLGDLITATMWGVVFPALSVCAVWDLFIAPLLPHNRRPKEKS